MKKLLYLTAVATLALASCKENDETVAVTGVTLSQTTATLTVGATLTLTPTVAPDNADNKAVTWTSSDIAVATVRNGKVTAVAAGTATITVTTEDGGKTASCTVTVATIDVTDVTLSSTIDTLAVGKTLTLTATVLPTDATNKNITWTSSDTAVATVSNGTVKAVEVGTAFITVATEDGNKIATCTVTVVIPATSVTLDRVTATLVVNNPTVLVATVHPSNATNKNVVWASSNTAVAMVNEYGVVMPIGSGTAIVTATTAYGGKTATCVVTAYVPYSGHMTLNGITWAEVNVDDYKTFAARPDMYTKFYQWNRSTAWSATAGGTGSWDSSADPDSIWSAANDPCPTGWRLPISEELDALINAGSTWATRGNEVAGRFFGVNHASCWLPDNMTGCIFLPASGYRSLSPSMGSGGVLMAQSYDGYYWSGTQSSNTGNFYLTFSDLSSYMSNLSFAKANGYNVRCVQ
jgi:uncharacterized protein (TIGR02145 family)